MIIYYSIVFIGTITQAYMEEKFWEREEETYEFRKQYTGRRYYSNYLETFITIASISYWDDWYWEDDYGKWGHSNIDVREFVKYAREVKTCFKN